MNRDRGQLAERSRGRSERARVKPRVVARRRRLESPRVSNHRSEQCPCGRHRIVAGAQLRQRGDPSAPKPFALLLDSRWIGDGPAAQPALDEVHRPALEPRERGAQEREQLAATTAGPGEAQERDQRLAQRGVGQASAGVEHVRDSGLAEDDLERGTPAVGRIADDADPSRLRSASDQPEQFAREELDGPARARTFEEPKRAVE